jgi:hypothetical protein
VRIDRRHRQRLEPERRLVFECARRDLCDDVVANADIGDDDLAASLPALGSPETHSVTSTPLSPSNRATT